ncbi:hypothetical protein [Chitinimonas lacunae]|uniref:Transporter substrate-binding domain-containing protein n=1 Tax=Chitinimonas lacunae TaxID=1963018 RepID=A0ABV8MMV9_9NEIS
MAFGLLSWAWALDTVTIARPGLPRISSTLARVETRLTAAYSALGITPRFIDLPPLRATLYAATGQIDGEMVRVAIPPEYQDRFVRVNVVVAHFNVVVITANAALRVERPEDLGRLRVGVVRGIYAAEETARYAARIEAAESYEALYQMLRLGRIDAVLSVHFEDTGPRRGPYLRHDVLVGHVVNEAVTRWPGYHFLNSRHLELAKRLTQQLRKPAHAQK